MSEEQLKALLKKVKGDTNLQEKLKAAADADAVVVIAQESGVSISADDLQTGQEISDEALDDVVGGSVGGGGGVGRNTPLLSDCQLWQV